MNGLRHTTGDVVDVVASVALPGLGSESGMTLMISL